MGEQPIYIKSLHCIYNLAMDHVSLREGRVLGLRRGQS